MSEKTPPPGRPISLLGLAGLGPDLLRASNAASGFACCTGSVWFALHSSLIPPCFDDLTRELAVQNLKALREKERQWRADLHACREELVRACNPRPARAGGLIATSAHQLAVAYYDALERDLWSAAIRAGLFRGERVSPEMVGEHLDTFAKVIAGGKPDDAIVKAPCARSAKAIQKRRAGIGAWERLLTEIDARRELGTTIGVLIEQEAIEAKARTKMPAPVAKPNWDGDNRTLHFRGSPIKTYRKNSADRQIEILEAFEKAGWPSVIPDPFRNPSLLSQTIRDLNDAVPLDTILFRGDGSGGVRWDPMPSP